MNLTREKLICITRSAWLVPTLVLAALLCAWPVAAQPVSGAGPAVAEDDRGWFAFGLGPGRPYGLVAVATANFGRERVVQAGFHAHTEFNLLGRSASVNAFNVGVGRSRASRWERTALAAGPAVVWGLREAADARSRYTTAGVVVSGQAMFTPVPELGLGVDAFVNVNPVRSGYGVGFTFVFEANK